jgi:hypothetical protein
MEERRGGLRWMCDVRKSKRPGIFRLAQPILSLCGCFVKDIVRVCAFSESQEGRGACAIQALAVAKRFSARILPRVGVRLSSGARRPREIEK